MTEKKQIVQKIPKSPAYKMVLDIWQQKISALDYIVNKFTAPGCNIKQLIDLVF